MKIHSRKVPPAGEQGVGPEYSTVTSQSPFLYLMLDLPSTPLFAEDSEQNIIPQVPHSENTTCLPYLVKKCLLCYNYGQNGEIATQESRYWG